MTTTRRTTMNIGDAVGQTIKLDPQGQLGTVTLVEVGDTTSRQTVLLVIPDERAATAWGCPGRAGTVIGGIAHDSGPWEATAYTDRLHLRTGGPVYDLPAAPSRVRAARGLLRWWNYLARYPQSADRIQPHQLRSDLRSALVA